VGREPPLRLRSTVWCSSVRSPAMRCARPGSRALVVADDIAADVPSRGCSGTATESLIPPHPRTTVVADLRDHAVRFLQWREWSGGSRRCCESQGERDSDQSDHFTSSSDTSRGTRRLIKLGSDQTPEAHAFGVGAGRGRRHQVPQRRLDVATPTSMWQTMTLLRSANSWKRIRRTHRECPRSRHRDWERFHAKAVVALEGQFSRW
jgi:hypothetical protein